jgi:hypothetical protein
VTNTPADGKSPPKQSLDGAPGLKTIFEDLFHVPTAVDNRDYLQRLRVGSIDDQVGIDRKEFQRLIRQILAPMTGTRATC